MSTSSLSIVYASDNRGVMPLAVSMHSLLKHAAGNSRYNIHVLSNGISESSRLQLQSMVLRTGTHHNLSFIDVPPNLLAGRMATTAWPVAAWARVFIPELLLNEHGIVLYLDIDTLICQDLTPLLETSLNGLAIGAVLEHCSHIGSHFNQRLGIPLASPGYFNSGVLLMDLDRFREQGLVRKILDYAEQNRVNLVCADQDALNGALHDNLQPIHHKWNWHDGRTRLMLKRSRRHKMDRGASFEVTVEAALRPGILHYQGKHKPWRYNYRIEGRRYLNAMIESGIGEYPLPGWTLRKWLKLQLYRPIYWLTWKKINTMDSRITRGKAHDKV